MNILFSFAPKSHKQIEDAKKISTVLQNIGKSIFFCKEPFVEIGYPIESNLNNNIDVAFGIVVSYTNLGLQQVLPFAQQKQIPIIHLVKGSEIAMEYSNISFVSRIVVIGETELVPMEILRKDFVSTIPLFPPFKSFTNQESIPLSKDTKEQKHLLIDISSTSLKKTPVYQLARLCNTLIELKITILYKNKSLLPIFNTNVTVLDKNDTSIEILIAQSDIVIANGNTILKSLMAGKLCVVVGELGYGGIINPQTLKAYYQNNFQGRIGGYLNEYIPEHLLRDDIRKLTMLENEDREKLIDKNKKAFFELYKEVTKRWENTFSRVIEQEKEVSTNLINCSLQLSSDFELMPFLNEKFILTYNATRQVHSNFGKEEAEIILLFKEPAKVKDALEKSDYKEESEMFMEFIQMLVNEKILVLYEK